MEQRLVVAVTVAGGDRMVEETRGERSDETGIFLWGQLGRVDRWWLVEIRGGEESNRGMRKNRRRRKRGKEEEELREGVWWYGGWFSIVVLR